MIYAFRFFRWRIVVNPTNQQPSNWCHSWNMSRPCFRQPVPVKENFSKPPKLRCSKPQGKVINTAVLLPAAVSLTTDFPLTPTPCLGLRVCQVWYIYIFWYETEKEWKRKKIMWLFRSYVKIVLYYKIFSCSDIKNNFETLDIYIHTPINFFQPDNMCTENMFAAGKKNRKKWWLEISAILLLGIYHNYMYLPTTRNIGRRKKRGYWKKNWRCNSI